jgi:hypothetical protein
MDLDTFFIIGRVLIFLGIIRVLILLNVFPTRQS